jgi:hypothetical protein
VRAETPFGDLRCLQFEVGEGPVPWWCKRVFQAGLVGLGFGWFFHMLFRPEVNPGAVGLMAVGVLLCLLGLPWAVGKVTGENEPLVLVALYRDGSAARLSDPDVSDAARERLRDLVARVQAATSLKIRGAERLAPAARVAHHVGDEATKRVMPSPGGPAAGAQRR